MALKFELLRPDDLLYLQIETENLRLNVSAPGQYAGEGLALALDNPAQPGFLIVGFPPQSIAEEAYFESSPTQPPAEEAADPYNQHTATLPETPAPNFPAGARMSATSRLVFRIPAGSETRIPFTTAGLLDWTGLELNVSPLADIPPEPSDEQAQNAPNITPPGRLETTIELPYRLALSPNSAVAWLHARLPKTLAGVTELWHTRLALRDEQGNPQELTRQHTAALRAIWSPDYNPNKFQATDPPLFQDDDPDWPGAITAMAVSDRHDIVVLTSAFHGFVKDEDAVDAYEPEPIYAERLMLSALGGWLRSRGSWDPPVAYRLRRPRIAVNDRLRLSRDLLNLLPLRERFEPHGSPAPDHGGNGGNGAGLSARAGSGALDAAAETAAAPRAELEIVEELGAAEIGQVEIEGSPEGDDLAAAPAPEQAETAQPGPQDLELGRADLFELHQGGLLWPRLLGEYGYRTNLSEWTHVATQGRDHFVRIVYEGHLFPFGHRAALIKVTERMVRDQKNAAGQTTPVAYLVQHMYIVVRQPERNFEEKEIADRMENEGRGLPFRKVRLTTLVTPNIAHPFPPKTEPCPENTPHLCGSNDSFWVRLGSGASQSDDFKFHVVAEDHFGHLVNFTAALIFVPFSETERAKVAEAYRKSGDARRCPVPAEKLTYAAPAPEADNTTLATTALVFDTHPVGGSIKKYAGFMPKLAMASVNLPAVEAMLGKPAAANIAYAKKYLEDAADNTSGLFAQVVKESSPGVIEGAELVSNFAADQAGGFATPNMAISGLTQKLGPQAGSLDKIAQDVFDPADFFGKVAGSAKLFGVLPLMDVLQDVIPATLASGAPKLQVKRETLPSPPNTVITKLTATLDWNPKIPDKDVEAGIVTFHPRRNDDHAALRVQGRMEQTITLPPPPIPEPGTSTMEGELTDFTIELMHVVEVLFRRFAFTANAGSKLNVGVELDPGTPVRFIEDLEFVDELRKNIPPDLFGDGPSLDINLERIKAGFSLALPPVSLGVFSLRDVSLAAFIELPFLDGRPLFDFAFCSRERPFNLTVAFLGGGGFFHLQIDTLGVKLLEASLEFGASAAIDLGVASGGVHIMAGIYFSMQRKTIDGVDIMAATLAGYLRMGGELSVLGLISVSLEFYLMFAYETQKNAAYGVATLTVKVEVLFFSTSVEITVEKRFGGASGDPVFLDTFDTPAIWQEYAGAFA